MVLVRHQRLERERTDGRVRGGTDAAHVADERLAREGVDGDAHVLTGREDGHVALGHVAAELQRVVLDEPEDHRALLHVRACVDQPCRDGAVEGRADRRPLELDAQLVATRTRHLECGPYLLVLLRRDDAAATQRPPATFIGGRLLEARLGLAQLRLDLVLAHPREHLVPVDPVAEVGLDGDEPALDLARDLGLRRGRERTDHGDGALDRSHGGVGDGNGHGLRLGCGRRLGPRPFAAGGCRDAERRDQRGGAPGHPAILRRRAGNSTARSRPRRYSRTTRRAKISGRSSPRCSRIAARARPSRNAAARPRCDARASR